MKLLKQLNIYPDIKEDNNRRSNKTLNILSSYNVDPNSFLPYIDYETSSLIELTGFLSAIENSTTTTDQVNVVCNLLFSICFAIKSCS